MRDLAVLMNGLVHDLRNPLGVIRNNLYLLRQRVPQDDPRITRSIDRIDDQVTVASRMLEALQVFYRGDSPNRQRVNLNDVVRAVLSSATVPDLARLELDLADDLPLVSADPQLLDTALRALIRNAVEAMPEGGTLRFSTGRRNGAVRLAVTDSGVGIPEEIRDRVFEPLFSTRPGHSGLGLAVVAKVMRSHRGSASVQTGEPGGTTVALDFPPD